MNISSSYVVIFSQNQEDRSSIFDALKSLLSLNYTTKNLSVLGRGACQESIEAIGIFKKIDQIRFKGKQDDFWQSLWRLLSGEAFLYIPKFGSLVVAGGLSSVIMSENGLISSHQRYTTLSRALHLVGIPARSIEHYESLLKKGNMLLIVNGDNQEVENACLFLESLQKSHEVSLHFVNPS